MSTDLHLNPYGSQLVKSLLTKKLYICHILLNQSKLSIWMLQYTLKAFHLSCDARDANEFNFLIVSICFKFTNY